MDECKKKRNRKADPDRDFAIFRKIFKYAGTKATQIENWEYSRLTDAIKSASIQDLFNALGDLDHVIEVLTMMRKSVNDFAHEQLEDEPDESDDQKTQYPPPDCRRQVLPGRGPKRRSGNLH